MDLGFVGPRFTWCNGRHGSHRIKERLDKGYANTAWSTLFPRTIVSHLPRTSSDHCPSLLQSHGSAFAGPKPLCFKQFWLKEPSSADVIQDAWHFPYSRSSAFRLTRKLNSTKHALQRWNRETIGFLPTRIQLPHQQFASLEKQPPSDLEEAPSQLRSQLQAAMKKKGNSL